MTDARRAAAALRPVDALEVLVLVDNVSDTLSSQPEGVDSQTAVLRERGLPEMAGERLAVAHHGLSLLLTAHVDGTAHTLLFDGGPEGAVLERNADRLGVDLGTVEAIVLSHGHWDHAGGLLDAVRLVHAANGGRPVPYFAHPGMFRQPGRRLPSGDVLPLAAVPAVAELERAGAAPAVTAEPQVLGDGAFLLSGEIPRVTAYEQGVPNHVRRDGPDAEWTPDPLLMDERFLAVHLRDRGAMVFSACSHAGVVNVMFHARDVLAPTPLYGVMGGFHLAGGNERIIPETVADLQRLELRRLIAGHCTGWRAFNALLNAIGDDAVQPLSVGSRYRL